MSAAALRAAVNGVKQTLLLAERMIVIDHDDGVDAETRRDLQFR
jgi:hypothetical protein